MNNAFQITTAYRIEQLEKRLASQGKRVRRLNRVEGLGYHEKRW